MKKIFLLLTATGLIALAGCSGKKESTKIPGMMELDLSSHGLPIMISVPDSARNKFEIVTQSWGATEIKVGKDFQISISEGDGDITLAKSDVAGNDVNKFKRYVIDEPTTILYESEITEPEFHLYSVVKLEKASYVVEDIKGEIFSEKMAQKMAESAKSIRVKETPAAS